MEAKYEVEVHFYGRQVAEVYEVVAVIPDTGEMTLLHPDGSYTWINRNLAMSVSVVSLEEGDDE